MEDDDSGGKSSAFEYRFKCVTYIILEGLQTLLAGGGGGAGSRERMTK